MLPKSCSLSVEKLLIFLSEKLNKCPRSFVSNQGLVVQSKSGYQPGLKLYSDKERVVNIPGISLAEFGFQLAI